MHPSQGGVFVDPPPLSNFTQQERGCANNCVHNSSPLACGGGLWVLALSDTPSLTRKVQGGGAHWRLHQPVIGGLLTLSSPKTACACGAGWKSPPWPIETEAATGTTVTEQGQLCNVREQHLILETKICFEKIYIYICFVCFVFQMCRS